MELSKRLTMIADMVSAGNRLADIGTDHGFIPVKLVSEGRIPSALAMDIGEGPLARAKEHVKDYGLENQIECRLSNGYEKLEAGEADTTVIAGMGGELMVNILSRGEERGVLTNELVLSPHSEWNKVRHFLPFHGYQITEENMVCEDRKYYVVIKAIRCSSEQLKPQSMTEMEEQFGPDLIAKKHPVLKEYLAYLRNRYEGILRNLEGKTTESAIASRTQIAADLDLVKGAQSLL